MTSPTSLIKPLALAAMLAAASSAHAVITIYTTSASFAAATTLPGVDTYTGFSISGTTPSPITRVAGAYAYTGTASTSTFFGAGTTANPWLSTNIATDTITFGSFSAGVRAVGGNFFGSNISGLFQAGDVTLTATDASGSVSQTIVGATVSSFLGFVSTGPITSLVIQSVQAGSTLWPTVDNLTLAQAAVVPEPEAYAMAFAGLAALGVFARRRRA